MARKFRQVNEGLDWVFEATKKEEQIIRLKEYASRNQTVVPLVRMGVGAEKVEWGLPEGMPETTKIDKDMPDGMGETTIQMEWRRIKTFLDPKGNLRNLPPWKQEMNWVQILEGLHHKEAEVLTAVKDGTMLKLYPKLEKLLKDLGIEEYNKPVKKTRKKKKADAE
jgi:sugar (pentulose or hexulose) kinase